MGIPVTLANVQVQISLKDVSKTIVSEDDDRIVIYFLGNEVILDRDTVTMLHKSFKKRRRKTKVKK